jgi:hypothetical protein
VVLCFQSWLYSARLTDCSEVSEWAREVENEFLHHEDRYFLSDWYGLPFQPLGLGKVARVCGVEPAKFKDLRLQRALCLDSCVISSPVRKILRRGLYTVWEKLWYFSYPLIFSFLECQRSWVSYSEVQMEMRFLTRQWRRSTCIH